jgi:hypothetical protein
LSSFQAGGGGMTAALANYLKLPDTVARCGMKKTKTGAGVQQVLDDIVLSSTLPLPEIVIALFVETTKDGDENQILM